MQRHIHPLFLTIAAVLCIGLNASAQTSYDTSPQSQTGDQVYGSYFGANIDTVSLYNGNLTLSIPLFSLTGRELPYGLTLTYNSQKWQNNTCGGTPCDFYTGGWQKTNVFGSDPSFFAQWNTCDYNPNDGYQYEDKFDLNVYWIDGSGAKHRYKGTGWNTYPYNSCSNGNNGYQGSWDSISLPTLDSDGSTFWTGNYESWGPDPARINFKNGYIRYFRDHNATSPSYDYVSPNGNYLVNNTLAGTFAGQSSYLPAQDTLGRTVSYSSAGAYYTWSETYTVVDSNGTNRSYVLGWTVLTGLIGPWTQTQVQLSTLTSITLPNGKSYSFQYNHPQGFLTQVTLPSGAYIKYVYPASPNNTSPAYDQVIERHVSPDGTVGSEQVWQYSGYTGFGTSASARTVTVTSPVSDKVVHTFNTQGQETATQWQTSSGTTLKEVDSSWSQVDIESNQQANTPQVNTIKTSMNGSLLSTQTVTYDGNMNVTQQVLTEGVGLPGSVHSETDITYQTISGNYAVKASQTLTAVDPVTGNFVLQGKTTYGYDEYNLTARYGVPNQNGNSSQTGRGNLTTVTQYKDPNNSVVSHMKYDSVGNVVEKDDPLSHATLIDFTDNFSDSVNRNTFAYPKKVTNPLGQYATTKYDFNTGLIKQVTNTQGNNTTTAYDLMNRVMSVTEPNGRITSFSYDDTNRITTKTVTVDSSGNLGRVKTYFDGLYRVSETRTNDPEGEYAVDTVYDAKGRKSELSNPYRVSGGSQIWTTTTYDALDRPTQVQAPDNSTVQYAYSYNQTTVTDEAGNARRYTNNALGQMTKVEEPNPTLDNVLVTNYTYYAFGPLHQSNQSGQTRTFVNDWLSRQTSQALPESGTMTFAYDNASRLTSKTDARNITTTFSYDNADRPTGKSYNDGTTPSVTWSYDANGYTGLKTSMTDGLGSVSFSYDNMNRLTQESRTLTGVGTFNTSYGYNIKGDVTSMTYPSGRVVNFNYAIGGGCCNSRLASVVDQTTNTTMNATMNYDAGGNLLNKTLGNGVVLTYSYNNRLQQTAITAASGSATLMNFTYSYGTSSTNTGRVLSRTDAVQPEHSTVYSYDSIYRLSQVMSNDSNSSWGIAWAFDVWGNRLTQTPLGLTTSKIGTQTLGYANNQNIADTYDAAGNETNDGLHNYTFSAENQVLTMGGGAATYAYDGTGRRMKKVTSVETTYTFYGPSGVISEFTTLNATATATAAASTDRCLFHTTDTLGSAVLVMTANGTVIENNRTLPYGEAWLASDNSATSTNDKKFNTYQRDQESGLDYAMHRYYGNSSGRFSSPDSEPMSMNLTQPVSLNRYVYVSNDPINETDPTGLLAKIIDPCLGREDILLCEAYRKNDCGDSFVPSQESGFCPPASQLVNPPRLGGLFPTRNPVTCRDWSCIPAAEAIALKVLQQPGCSSLFGNIATRAGGKDPASVLMNIINGGVNGGQYGRITFGPIDCLNCNAQTTPQDPTFGGPRVLITINTVPLVGEWNLGNASYNALTLLHELAHAYNDLYDELGGFALTNFAEAPDPKAFDKLLKQKCFLGQLP
jgi:RHS repeat-associated protein